MDFNGFFLNFRLIFKMKIKAKQELIQDVVWRYREAEAQTPFLFLSPFPFWPLVYFDQNRESF